MDAHDDTQQTIRPAAEPVAKRAYRRPELVEFGDVRELTRGNSTTKGEGRGSKRH